MPHPRVWTIFQSQGLLDYFSNTITAAAVSCPVAIPYNQKIWVFWNLEFLQIRELFLRRTKLGTLDRSLCKGGVLKSGITVLLCRPASLDSLILVVSVDHLYLSAGNHLQSSHLEYAV